MFIRLPPEQVMKYWVEIKECIASSLPKHIKESDESLLAIQQRLLTGIFECWIICDNEVTRQIYGVATTRFVIEEISNIKNLLIFTVTIIERHPENIWEDCIEVLKRYAIEHDCSNIIAYSEVPQMLTIAENLGANTDTRLVYFDLINYKL